jgi:hypothetical protein
MDWLQAYEQKHKIEKNAGEAREKTGEVKTSPRAAQPPREFQFVLSRTNWKQRNRRVKVGDSQARKTVCNKTSGHILSLFSADQTEEMW